jgi:sugar phosphate isomerase/epimerase
VTPASGASRSSATDRPAVPVGLQLWSVRDDLAANLPRTLARVRDVGFEIVELAGTGGLPAPAFRAALDAAGLTAPAMHVPYEALRAEPRTVWDHAAALGVRHVGIPNLPAPAGRLTTEAASREADTLNAWGDEARARGLRFFLHTHGPELRMDADGARPLDTLAAHTEAGLVSFELDLRWALEAGASPEDLFRAHRGRWCLLHLRDARRQPDGRFEEVGIGDGDVPISRVLARAVGAGVAAFFIEDEAPGPWPRIASSLRNTTAAGRSVARRAAGPGPTSSRPPRC